MELVSVLVTVVALLSATAICITSFIRADFGALLGLIGVVLFSLSACSESEVAVEPGANRGSETSNSSSAGMEPREDPRGSDASRIAALPHLPEYALNVESYYGTYEVSKKDPRGVSKSLQGPVLETWPEPPTAARPYRIGVLFPHFKDSYWLAVNYGIIAEARRIGVAVQLLDADGYGNLGDQRKQLASDLVKADVDGIILASIDYEKLDTAVGDVVAKGIPVIGIINDIRAPAIQAKAMVSFYDMGYVAGRHVLGDSGGRAIKVAFLPGPEGSGWAKDSWLGFKQAIADNPDNSPKGSIELLPELYGKTETPVQRSRVRSVLDRNTQIDYLVGNAVAAGVATELVKDYQDKHPNIKIVATYITPQVYDGIKLGLIAAAPTDLTVDQGRMAVHMMVRLLNGEKPGNRGVAFPFRSGPVIQIVTRETIGRFRYERLFGPRDFQPIRSYRAGS